MTSRWNTATGETNFTSEGLTYTDLNDTLNAAQVPIGGIIAWLKTFDSQDSGTTTSTTANKLVQSGQNFLTTVDVGMIVHNTTDSTFAYVTAVDSDTTLSLSADVMVSGETYVIYATPKLPASYVECAGQVLSDADSPYNGATIPDLNAGTYRMLRGAATSGTTGGSDTNSHTHDVVLSTAWSNADPGGSSSPDIAESDTYTSSVPSDTNNLPAYYSVVWIMRVK